MHLDDFVQPVTAQLTAAAALGDDRTQQVAAALATTADAAVRLAVIQAVSAAAAETTLALQHTAPGAPTVTVQVDGDELNVHVAAGPAEPLTATPTDEGDASARISLRLTESLKSELEQAAAGDGLSVNSWLIRAATSALANRRSGWTAPDLSGGRGAHRISGWVTG